MLNTFNMSYHWWRWIAFCKLSLSSQHSIQFCCPFFSCISCWQVAVVWIVIIFCGWHVPLAFPWTVKIKKSYSVPYMNILLAVSLRLVFTCICWTAPYAIFCPQQTKASRQQTWVKLLYNWKQTVHLAFGVLKNSSETENSSAVEDLAWRVSVWELNFNLLWAGNVFEYNSLNGTTRVNTK